MVVNWLLVLLVTSMSLAVKPVTSSLNLIATSKAPLTVVEDPELRVTVGAVTSAVRVRVVEAGVVVSGGVGGGAGGHFDGHSAVVGGGYADGVVGCRRLW